MIQVKNIKNGMKVLSRQYGIGKVLSFRISDANRAYATVEYKDTTIESPLSQLAEVRS